MDPQHDLWSELSEEWKSEPRSSSSSVALPTYSGPSRQPVKDLHRGSRIPRSTGTTRGRKSSRTNIARSHDVSQGPLRNDKGALSERSTSDINSRSHSSPPPAQGSKDTCATMNSRPSTVSSAQSIVKHSNGKTKGSGPIERKTPMSDAPAWQQLAMRKQDLFSPIGLEGVFQQAPGTASPHVKSSLHIAYDAESMPSSPPLWRIPRCGTTEDAQNQAEQSPSMLAEITKEHEDDDSVAVDGQTTHQEAVHHELLDSSDDLSHPQQKSLVDHDDAGSAAHNTPGSKPSDRQSIMAEQRTDSEDCNGTNQHEHFVKTSSILALSHPAPQSGIGSSSSSATGGFSPVFISKHNTVDGRVDYAALDPSDLPPISEHVNRDRGGRSDDGSFKRRPLSPSISSSAIPSDSVVPSDSVSQVHRQPCQSANTAPLDHEEATRELEQLVLAERSQQSSGTFEQRVAIDPQLANDFQDIITSLEASDDQRGTGALVGIAEKQNDGDISNISYESSVIQVSQDSSKSETSSPMSDLQSVETVLRLEQENGSIISRTTMVAKAHDRTARNEVRAAIPHSNAEKSVKVVSVADAAIPQEYHTDTSTSQHQQLRMIAGRKRKDALYNEEYHANDASSLAKRDILRPRNPTPGHGRRSLPRTTSATASMARELRASENLGRPSDSVLIPARSREADTIRAMTSEIATFRMHSRIAQLTGVRKQSISTQDYIDEAMKIMDLIRARKNVNSDPASSEVITENNEDEYRIEPTPQLLSRPPSRDGPVSGWRSNAFEQVDPKVLNHLRKYEETGDESFLVSSILRTVKITETPDMIEEDGGFRIMDHANSSVLRRHSDPALPSMTADENASATETRSSNRSTDSSGRTIHTTSTQRTRNMARIAPENVSHLIQEEEAGMRFDTQRQTWIRNKTRVSPKADGLASSSSGTEDDALGQIPDLSVNEQEEQARSRSPSQNMPALVSSSGEAPSPTHLHPKSALLAYTASIPGNVTQAELPCTCTSDVMNAEHLDEADVVELGVAENEDSLEISEGQHEFIHDKNYPSDTARSLIGLASKKREQSVFFSSPPVSRMWDTKHWTDSTGHEPDEADIDYERNVESSQLVHWKADSRDRSSRRDVANRKFYRNTSLSCVEERREISVTERQPDGRTMSLSLSISTPLPRRRPSTTVVQASSGLRHQSFLRSLSPLSDFSINQDDREHGNINTASKSLLQLSRRSSHVTGQSSLVVRNLVEKLTDAEPDEPYWDFMSFLDLTNQGLEALFALDQFCPRLERLDASNNGLKHLEGAPTSLRHLRLCNNSLTSLTSWSRLSNLQYLDISANEITSLEGCSSLAHLRELRADDNHLVDIEGVIDLDGLLHLSLRGNDLADLDFSGAGLRRLESLDASDNKITALHGLAALLRLRSLKLSHNSMTRFPSARPSDTEHEASRDLRMLDLSYNKLTSLDIGQLPRLEVLSADNNYLDHVKGIGAHARLCTLRLCDQILEQSSSITTLNDFARLTHLYLAGTSLVPLLPITTPFYHLQTLDVSFTGLQALPADFGLLSPALRSLNLNANSLKDLRPLDGIPGLKTLLASGNRLGRLRMLIRVMKRLAAVTGGALKEVDFRDNPLCVGFYPTTGQLKMHSKSLVDAKSSDDHMNEEDLDRDDADERKMHRLSHVLAAVEPEADEQHLARLDEDTKLKRRVYELLLAAKCSKLTKVDGMAFSRARAERKDAVWDALVGRGVVERAAQKTERDGVGHC